MRFDVSRHPAPATRRRRGPVPTSRAWLLAAVFAATAVQAQAPEPTRYVIVSWLPAQAALVTRQPPAAGAAATPVVLQQVVDGSAELCLTPAGRHTQTLVQVQPKEGGEARFVAVGGKKPACTAVGPGWQATSSSESAWYKALFSLLKPDGTGVRISASTAGSSRDPNAVDPAAGAQRDPCGLYPTAAGQMRIVAGDSALTLGTTLAEGTPVRWQPGNPGAAAATKAVVKDGRIVLPRLTYQVGQVWRLSTAGNGAATSPIECRLLATVVTPQASPLLAVKAYAPSLSADPASVHATLVASLLADAGQVQWFGWLLGTLQPAPKAKGEDLSGQVWRGWWAQARGAAARGDKP